MVLVWVVALSCDSIRGDSIRGGSISGGSLSDVLSPLSLSPGLLKVNVYVCVHWLINSILHHINTNLLVSTFYTRYNYNFHSVDQFLSWSTLHYNWIIAVPVCDELICVCVCVCVCYWFESINCVCN